MRRDNYQFHILTCTGEQLHGPRDTLAHKTEYSIVLKNNGKERCVALVSIDGHVVANIMVPPGKSTKLQRPVDGPSQNFIFLDSRKEGGQVLDASNPALGKITSLALGEVAGQFH